jgi:hypothetical protein
VYVDHVRAMLLFIIHPAVWLIVKTYQSLGTGADSSGWVLLSCMGIPAWFFLARLAAELPGTKLGKMYIWWIIFAVFHVWGLLIYFFTEKFINLYVFRRRAVKRLELADRTPDEILASPFSPIGSRMTGQGEIADSSNVNSIYMSELSSEIEEKSR